MGAMFCGLIGGALRSSASLQPFALLLLFACGVLLALGAPLSLFRPKWAASVGLGTLFVLGGWVVWMLAQGARSGFSAAVFVFSVVILAMLPAVAQIGAVLYGPGPYGVRGRYPRGPGRVVLAVLPMMGAVVWGGWLVIQASL